MLSKKAVILIVLSMTLYSSAFAQAPQCADGTKAVQELLKERLLGSQAEESLNRAEEGLNSPREATTSMQVAAPSSMTSSPSIVDGAASTSLFGLALDNSVTTGEDGAMTISINPFLLAMAKDPSVFYNNSLYGKKAYERLRRFSATLSLGGKGESFDRDGDGEADEALDAKNLDDIVGWEIRVRLGKNSRDRREKRNFLVFRDKVKPHMPEVGEGVNSFQSVPQWQDLVTGGCVPGSACVVCKTTEEWAEIVEQPWFEEAEATAMGLIAPAQRTIEEAWKEAAEIVDNRFISNLVIGGVDRKDDFGPDEKIKIALRSSWLGHTFNLEWSTQEGLMGAADPKMLKIGWQYSAHIMKDVFGKDGVEISAGGAYETFDDVPGAKHSTISKINAKLEFPLGENMKFPISVTWANHKDLFSDDEEVVGHFGINVDFGTLLTRLRGSDGS